MNENIMSNVTATIAAENANQTAEVAASAPVDEQHSLKNPIAARQLTKSRTDVSVVRSEDLVARHSLKRVQKFAHYEDYLHVAAALKIQQNYRGWKGRKDYLKIRDRIVKIQAHVRGHQVRKNYKKVLWSVGILEKVILRWRRRRTGLRGFRVEKPTEDASSEVKKYDDYEFLSVSRKQKFAGVEKALARVQSMARGPEAREQYMRLISNSEKLEMTDGKNQASYQNESSNQQVIDEILRSLNEGQRSTSTMSSN
ncbi:hypothetical protein TB2_021268 [Malus domestica]